MAGQIIMDKAGRVVLPKALRQQLQLAPGDRFDLSVEGDAVTLRPRRQTSPMRCKDGIWVFSAGRTLSQEEADRALTEIRNARQHQVSGELG